MAANITFSLNSAAVNRGLLDKTHQRDACLREQAQRGTFVACSAISCSNRDALAKIQRLQERSFPRMARQCTSFALTSVAAVAPGYVAKAATALNKAIVDPLDLVDQYAVGDPKNPQKGISRFFELLYGVAIRNDVSSRPGATSLLLGPFGHYERLSFWTHFLGALVFVVYAIMRHILVDDHATTQGALTTASGWTIAGVFLTSSMYHATSPDAEFTVVTRVLDYAAIYIGLTVSTTADIAVATAGFKNVPFETIADLPIACTILIAFFVWRRWLLPIEATWYDHRHMGHQKRPTCSISIGLFSRGHSDLTHAHARQATSLLIFGNFFMSVPAAYALLGSYVASVVLTLQVLGFVLVLGGMAIDRVLEFPDGRLIEGEDTCFACTNTCGAVLSSHALWHIVAVASAGCTVLSREFALSQTNL